MTTSTVTPEIVEFAQGVRAALADLPAEEVDDLTEGLEADLAEAYAEDLQRELPDPAAYATELRAAAGLPVRASAKAGVLSGLAQGWKDTRADIAIAIRRNPALASAVDFLGELRPAWWILRAWLATWIVGAVVGRDGGILPHDAWWFVLAAAIVVSVQWGRGRWLFRGLGPVIVIGNVAALVLLLPVVAEANSRSGNYYGAIDDSGYADASTELTGVYLNGTQVTNIYGYDAKGRPLQNVQLFDQDGNPLATSVPGGSGCLTNECNENGLWVPATLRNGAIAWNVFPMKMVKADPDNDGGYRAAPGAEPEERPLPFNQVPPLITTEKVAKSNE